MNVEQRKCVCPRCGSEGADGVAYHAFKGGWRAGIQCPACGFESERPVPGDSAAAALVAAGAPLPGVRAPGEEVTWRGRTGTVLGLVPPGLAGQAALRTKLPTNPDGTPLALWQMRFRHDHTSFRRRYLVAVERRGQPEEEGHAGKLLKPFYYTPLAGELEHQEAQDG